MKNNEVITGILIKKNPKSLVINVTIVPQSKNPLDPRYKRITIPYNDIEYITEHETGIVEGLGKHKKTFRITNTSPIAQIKVGNQKLGSRIKNIVGEFAEPIRFISRTEQNAENLERIRKYRRELPV